MRVLITICVACAVAGAQQTISPHALEQIEELSKEKAARTPVERKLDSRLHYAGMSVRGQRLTRSLQGFNTVSQALPRDAAGHVLVDIRADVSLKLLNAIRAAGATIVSSVQQYHLVRAAVPLLRLEEIAALPEVKFIRPADPGHHGAIGLGSVAGEASVVARVSSEGDVAHGADLVRSGSGINGAGVKVGVLSDGIDALASLQAAGDVGDVTVIPGQAGSGEEGLAMLEIVHDLAPGAQLYFATSKTGEAQMAANILALRAAGCDIILDDWTYFNEAVFQDGIIAQAVNTVTQNGALYFSDAQNSGNLDSDSSGTWEGDFVDGGTFTGNLLIHSFGNANNDLITRTSGFNVLSLKWSDPLGASANDYDFYLLDNSMENVLEASTNIQDGAQDPSEFLNCTNCLGDRLVIVRHPGAEIRALHVDTERGRLLIGTDGATFGHNAAGSAVTVAAVNVATAGGGLFTGGATNPVEDYSSDGPRRIFYQADGAPITPGNLLFGTAGGTLLRKDDVAAADCATGAAPGFTVFCGTSAATPHAGAIAALVKSGFPQLSVQEIVDTMKGTALDIMAPGIDRDSGSGIVMANRAVTALSNDPALVVNSMGIRVLDSTQVLLQLQVSNTSGMALGVSLDSLRFRTLNGEGMITSANPLPVAIGSLAPGQSSVVTLRLNVPDTVVRFSIASGFTSRNGSGRTLSSSSSSAVVR